MVRRVLSTKSLRVVFSFCHRGFKSALRNLLRNKRSTIINISGLAIGIASCLLIFLVVRYEGSYDRTQPNFDRIYHIGTVDTRSSGVEYTSGTPYPARETFQAMFPHLTIGVLNSGGSQLAVMGRDGQTITEKRFIETDPIFFADSNFFKIFSVSWMAGSYTVLDEPNTIVLSRSTAEKYFGTWTSAMGGLLKMDNLNTLRVGGIVADPPIHSDFPLKMIASYKTMQATKYYGYDSGWGTTSSQHQLYVLIPPNVNPAGINDQLKTYSRNKYKGLRAGNTRTFFIRPLSEVHSDTRYSNFGDHITPKSTLWTLTLIAAFILVMACINFINLSTVQAVNRSKEIGVRKVLGSQRSDLFWQLLGETAMTVLFSLMLAVGLAMLCLPFIRNIASITETLPILGKESLLFLASVFVSVSVMAGLYPAVVISGFRPILALKNKINNASVSGISLRRSLVVVQFALSQILIVGTMVAITQMSFVSHADLGLKKEAVLVISASGDSTQQARYRAFQEELSSIPSVKSVSLCSDVPSSENNWGTNFAYDHKPDENFSLFLKFADPDYYKTFGLQFVAGGPQQLSDTARDVVINETLVAKLGIKDPQSVIGKDFRTGGGQWKRICGVVKDFKTNSLREATRPIMISCGLQFYSDVAMKLSGNDLAATQKEVQKVWDRFFPEYANTAFFLDEKIAAFYKQEEQLALLYKIFAGIAVFLSCLGLYGLVSFMAIQRKREVGIRKVLGAGVAQIIYLFSREFTILILIAFLIAVPVAWYLMSEWLTHFAYRIDLNPLIFAGAGLLSMVIAWLTVGFKSWRAANANPVASIKAD